MEIKDNKTTYAVALLVLVLIIGIGILSQNMDFEGTSGKAINVPTESSVGAPVSTSAKVSINIMPPKEAGDEG